MIIRLQVQIMLPKIRNVRKFLKITEIISIHSKLSDQQLEQGLFLSDVAVQPDLQVAVHRLQDEEGLSREKVPFRSQPALGHGRQPLLRNLERHSSSRIWRGRGTSIRRGSASNRHLLRSHLEASKSASLRHVGPRPVERHRLRN